MKVALALGLIVCTALAQQVTQILPNDEVSLRSPKAISVGVGRIVYIADSGHHRVIAVDSTGKLVAESGHGGSSGSQMLWPVDVSASAGANVYVADAGNKRILKFSRFLEWQGEFEILSSDGQALEPRLVAASQQGDVFVYESDEGQLLRYDPLFTLQNRLGAASGRDFMQAPISLTQSDALGVLWLDRGGDQVHASDRFLSSQRSFPSSVFGARGIAALDSVFWLLNDQRLVSANKGSEVTSRDLNEIEVLKDASDIVCSPVDARTLYVLDRRGARLFRILFAE